MTPPKHGWGKNRGVARIVCSLPLFAWLLIAAACNGDESPPAATEEAETPATTAAATRTAVATSTPSPTPLPRPDSIALEPAFPGLPGLQRPVVMRQLPGQDQYLVVQQAGVVVSFSGQAPAGVSLVLDHSRNTSRGGNEEGMLGLALDPEFESNGYVYIYYSAAEGARRTLLSRFESSGAGESFQIDAASELVVLEVPQPFANHNGGALEFGPDGMLYVALGDGGSGGDPQGHGQDASTLLGSILRIDVRVAEAGRPYAIPADNPFAGAPAERDEIWAYGLRNPWRVSFDLETGLLWAGDVGQNALEEIDIIERGGNYGWNIMEASRCFADENCSSEGLILPVAEYGRDAGCSVTGGYVYRGSAYPALVGLYLYADYCTGRIWGLEADAAAAEDAVEPLVLLESGPSVASFAEDEEGEVYVLAFDGVIYRVVA